MTDDRRPDRPAELRPRPAHPVWKANLVMLGIVVVIMLLAVMSTLGGG